MVLSNADQQGGMEGGLYVIIKVVTQESTISIRKHIHGLDVRSHALWTPREIPKSAMGEMGTLNVYMDSMLKRLSGPKE